MIAFHYPPIKGSSGALRPLKFGKYLPEFGWDSSVLTVSARCYQSTDAGSLRQIPAGVNVYRSACFDTKAALSLRGRYPAFLAVPDRYVSWLPFGVISAVHLVQRDGFNVLYSTCPIPTAHLIALGTKLIMRVPWVADFRDPWVETEGSELRGRVRRSVELWLEKQVVLMADRVLVTTSEFSDYLRARYGPMIDAKLRVIHNGYDEDDFANVHVAEADAPFCITHAGLINGSYRDPAPFLRALRHCLDRGEVPADTRVNFMGAGQYGDGREFAALLAALRLDGVVRVVQRTPYEQTLAALVSSSVLLLLQGGDDTRILIPAKAFEYLRAGRPVLAIAPRQSATAKLVNQFGGCLVGEADDVADIAQKLAALAVLWRNNAHRVDRVREGLGRYSRRTATAELATTLNGVCGAPSTDRP